MDVNKLESILKEFSIFTLSNDLKAKEWSIVQKFAPKVAKQDVLGFWNLSSLLGKDGYVVTKDGMYNQFKEFIPFDEMQKVEEKGKKEYHICVHLTGGKTMQFFVSTVRKEQILKVLEEVLKVKGTEVPVKEVEAAAKVPAPKAEKKLTAEELFTQGKEFYDKRQYKESFDCYFKAANEYGFLPSIIKVGDSYEYGLGVEKNPQEAFRWYKKVADQHDPFGEYVIGEYYKNGFGVKQNLNTAILWYEKSAAQNFAEAFNSLGSIYYNELKKYDKAETYYLKAAEHGSVNGHYNLGIFYGTEKAGKQDLKKALAYFKYAVKHGSGKVLENSRNNVEVIEEMLGESAPMPIKAVQQSSNVPAELQTAIAQYNAKPDKNCLEVFEKYAAQGVQEAIGALIKLVSYFSWNLVKDTPAYHNAKRYADSIVVKKSYAGNEHIFCYAYQVRKDKTIRATMQWVKHFETMGKLDYVCDVYRDLANENDSNMGFYHYFMANHWLVYGRKYGIDNYVLDELFHKLAILDDLDLQMLRGEAASKKDLCTWGNSDYAAYQEQCKKLGQAAVYNQFKKRLDEYKVLLDKDGNGKLERPKAKKGERPKHAYTTKERLTRELDAALAKQDYKELASIYDGLANQVYRGKKGFYHYYMAKKYLALARLQKDYVGMREMHCENAFEQVYKLLDGGTSLVTLEMEQEYMRMKSGKTGTELIGFLEEEVAFFDHMVDGSFYEIQDQGNCVNCGICCELAPKLFRWEISEDEPVLLSDDIEVENQYEALLVCRLCPAGRWKFICY